MSRAMSTSLFSSKARAVLTSGFEYRPRVLTRNVLSLISNKQLWTLISSALASNSFIMRTDGSRLRSVCDRDLAVCAARGHSLLEASIERSSILLGLLNVLLLYLAVYRVLVLSNNINVQGSLKRPLNL